MNRREELLLNLTEVKADIEQACLDLGRDRSEVKLIAVTKTWPASDVDLLAELGVTDVGENRDQEAKPKRDEVHAETLTWHAIGQLQTNKAKSVASWADAVHSVDRPDLVKALAKAVVARVEPLGVLIQVNLDEIADDKRGGTGSSDAMELVDMVLQTPGLKLHGVMGVAPLAGDPEIAFAKLQAISNLVLIADPNANWISAGMSGDYRQALKFGATHLRIGSSILGNRAFQG
jgi:pyridoxal phosphate enzyme (YggS family)